MNKAEILCAIAGKNILVIGGTGFIGRWVITLLAEDGAHIRIVSKE